MNKKVTFLLKNDLTCFDAVIQLGNEEIKNLSVQSEGEFLPEILKLAGISELLMQSGLDIKRTKLTKLSGPILRIRQLDFYSSYLEVTNQDHKLLRYEVVLDEKILGSYSLTENLDDVHLIEHYCEIFKHLGYETALEIDD